jgi:hypothetical protein
MIMAARFACLFLILSAGLVLTGQSVRADSPQTHIDTDAGIRFTLPFRLYQRKSPLQIQNLIKDTFSGDLARHVIYSSAVYADGADDFIVVWRQAHAHLPTQYEFSRLGILAPLKSSGKVREVEIDEKNAVATFALDPAGPYKARIAMVLTRKDNVFIGYYSRTDEGTKSLAALLRTLEVDPGRIVRWSELDSGLKPMWSGVIIAGGFLCGFLGWLLFASVLAPKKRRQKKSGSNSTPDFDYKTF